MIPMLNVTIHRGAKVELYRFTDFFKGFEKIGAVRELFGDETEQVLNELKVEFCHSRRGYMWICDDDGHIVISVSYLENGGERDIYLDIIHELFHIKQFIEGKKLFDEQIEYVDNSIEIEAYKFTVREAKRIGMTDEEIFEYLKTNWLSFDDVKRLAKNVGINPRAVKSQIK